MISLKEIYKEVEEAAYTNAAGENFWGNKGAGILAICSKTKKILVPYRSEDVNEPNTYGVVGGKIDDEHAMDFAAEAEREFKEETGYSGNMKLIPAYIFKTPNGSFEYHNFIGLIDDEFEPKLNWETEKFVWVTFEELIKLQPKHFGLDKLLKDSKSLNIIKRYTK